MAKIVLFAQKVKTQQPQKKKQNYIPCQSRESNPGPLARQSDFIAFRPPRQLNVLIEVKL